MVFLLVLSFRALGIVDANSSTNTGAPPDGAPWANVGQLNGAGGIYIGGGWVLTVSHVGPGNIYLNSTTFVPDGTSLRLTNSDGSATDLVLFHLSSAPPLPSLALATNTPAALSQVDLIGAGCIAGSTQTNLGLYTGFYWSAAGAKSWGNNKVNLGGLTTYDIGYGTVTAFTMDFSSPGTPGPASQTSDEAQVAAGDSGGGVFQNTGLGWKLVGVLDAEESQVNQPAYTAAYGDETDAIDMATYGSQIVAVLKASPMPSLSISSSGGGVMVCWPDMGVNYTLQSTASLINPSWAAVSQSQVVTNGQIRVLVPAANNAQAFRLQRL